MFPLRAAPNAPAGPSPSPGCQGSTSRGGEHRIRGTAFPREGKSGTQHCSRDPPLKPRPASGWLRWSAARAAGAWRGTAAGGRPAEGFWVKRRSGPWPRTSLGSADLAQLGGSLGLVAREEGVGVLQAATEGEVRALGVGAEAAHLVLTVGQDLGHGGRGVGAGLQRGTGGGLAAGPALAQQGSRRKDEVMQHPGLRSQAGPPPPHLRLPGRWAGGGGGGGGGDRAGVVRWGRGWRRRRERNDDERPTAAERGGRGAVEMGRTPARGGREAGGGWCGQERAQFSAEAKERKWEGTAQWREWWLGE